MNNKARMRPSNAVRWTKCPGSIAYQNKLGIENTSSEFAKEGQDTHALAEKYLRTGRLVCLSSAHPDDILVDGEFANFDQELAIKHYANYVKSLGGTQFYEQAVDLSMIAQNMSGTCDALVFVGNTMHVVDFKYGVGNKIYAKDNLQLILYAIGAKEKFLKQQIISNVNLHIIQPRLNHIDVVDIPMDTLSNYASILKSAAIKSSTSTELCAGDEQCNFCPVKPTCPKLKELTEKTIATETFPDRLTKKEIGAILENKKLIIKWLNSVESHAVEQLTQGNSIDGYKLVNGKGARKWWDDDEAKIFLKEQIGDECIIKNLISVAQAEKLISFDILYDKWHKIPGKPTLAKCSDKRPSIT